MSAREILLLIIAVDPNRNYKVFSDNFPIVSIVFFLFTALPENYCRCKLSVCKCQCCRRYGDSHGYGYGMGIGTVMNPHGPERILWEYLNGWEIKRKCIKHTIIL